MLDFTKVYLLLVKPPIPILEFYAIPIQALQAGVCERERILQNSSISMHKLSQVDPSHHRVVAINQENFEVWD